MRTTYSVTTWQNYGINQTPRETLIHRSGSASRENSVQVFATRTNSGSERNKFLSNQNKINQQSLAELKWWKENFFLQNGKSLRIGIPQSLIQTDTSKTGWAGGGGGWQEGGSLSGNHHGENLVISGKDKTYQYTGAPCSETCNIDLYQRQIGNSNPRTNRQYNSFILLGKNEGNLQSKTATRSQGNMGRSFSQWNSSYSRLLTKQYEYSGRLAIQKSQRFE